MAQTKRRNAKIISVSMQKGGTGKTTTSVNLGAALAEKGHQVLLWDLDPQGGMTVGLDVDPDTLTRTTYHVLIGEAEPHDIILQTATPHLHLAPANWDLLGIEMEVSQLEMENNVMAAVKTFQEHALHDLAQVLSEESMIAARRIIADSAMKTAAQVFQRDDGDEKKEELQEELEDGGLTWETALKEALEDLREEYDFIIVDNPPHPGPLTIMALMAAQQILIPVQCESLALRALKQLYKLIARVQLNNPGIDIRVLRTIYDSRKKHHREIFDEIAEVAPDHILKTYIKQAVVLTDSMGSGCPVLELDSGSNSAKAYRQLARELLSLNGGASKTRRA